MPAGSAGSRAPVIHAEWRGIALEIGYIAKRFAGMDHIEVRSAESVPLPITATGYRSLFILPEHLEEHGDPETYVLAWLDHEATSAAWKRYEAEDRQLSLF
jgi:hypothetical protein